MEITTLQQRIEERAKNKLLNDLVLASNKEQEIVGLFYENYKPQIEAHWYHPSYGSGYIKLDNDFTNQLFEKMLPAYVQKVTDEILSKIDEIDYLVNKETVEDLPY